MHTYRPEIDGLRCVAVCSVVFYHAGLGAVAGGYVGVDIFFVISGYVIASKILTEIGNDKFSYYGFYEGRVRRLIPALLAVLLVTWLTATLFLDPEAYREFSHSLIASVFGAANWFFYFNSGYFDAAADEKPLLHLWSLGIEEQFYLVFAPFVLFLIPRILILRRVSILIAVISFSYATILILSDFAEQAFYDVAARAWELLVGAALAFRLEPPSGARVAVAARWFGAAAIAASVFGIGSQTFFPGIGAALPVLGTALLIWASHQTSDPVYALLRTKPAIAVGRVSYGWYLWHWPAYVFLPFFFGSMSESPLVRLAAAAATLCAGFVSYHLIEMPIRRKRLLASRAAAFRLVAATIAVVVVLAAPGYFPPADRLRTNLVYGGAGDILTTLASEEELYRAEYNINYMGKSEHEIIDDPRATCSFDESNTRERVLDCLVSKGHPRSVLVIGDSVGRDTFNSLRLAYPDVNFLMLHQSSCPPADFLLAGARNCFPDLIGLVSELDQTADLTAIFLAYRHRPKEWKVVEPTLTQLRAKFDNVVLFSANPVWAMPPARYVAKTWEDGRPAFNVPIGSEDMVPFSYAEIVAEAKEMALRLDVQHVDVLSCFCDADRCTLFDGADPKRPLYWDRYHLTRFGIERLAGHLRDDEVLRSLLGEGGH